MQGQLAHERPRSEYSLRVEDFAFGIIGLTAVVFVMICHPNETAVLAVWLFG